jgi:hypothetical protein
MPGVPSNTRVRRTKQLGIHVNCYNFPIIVVDGMFCAKYSNISLNDILAQKYF